MKAARAPQIQYWQVDRDKNQGGNMATVSGREGRARKETPKRSAAQTTKLSDEEIRLLAYDLWERRCASGDVGDAAGDWLKAERLLSAPAASTKGN